MRSPSGSTPARYQLARAMAPCTLGIKMCDVAAQRGPIVFIQFSNRGIAKRSCLRRHIANGDASRSDNGIVPYCYISQKYCSCAVVHPVSNDGRRALARACPILTQCRSLTPDPNADDR